MINKAIGFNQKTMKSYEGWSCGWCMRRDDGSNDPPFRGANASKALWHVLQESGHDIRPCRGNIPANRMRQYQNLSQTKALQKDARAQRSALLSSNIDDLQDRTVHSMTEGRRISGKGEASAPRSSLKEPWAITETSSLSSSTPKSIRRLYTSFFQPVPKRTKKVEQQGGGHETDEALWQCHQPTICYSNGCGNSRLSPQPLSAIFFGGRFQADDDYQYC
jgi:hypothetical protein